MEKSLSLVIPAEAGIQSLNNFYFFRKSISKNRGLGGLLKYHSNLLSNLKNDNKPIPEVIFSKVHSVFRSLFEPIAASCF